MNPNSDTPENQPLFDVPQARLLDTVLEWQKGQLPREVLVSQFSGLPGDQGIEIKAVIHDLLQLIQLGAPGRTPPHPAEAEDTDSWRHELMSSRAKAWPFPDSAGMLVGPTVIILTDGQRGVMLRDQQRHALPGSIAASLMLLCQTIVMAQHAVDAKELEKLQNQRMESASTSLSEIEPIR